LLAKDEILAWQSAARPEEPSEHTEPEQKQVEHGGEL